MVESQGKDEDSTDIKEGWPVNDEEVPYDEGSEPDAWKEPHPDDIGTDE